MPERVDRDLPVPVFEQLAAILRAQIKRGEIRGRVPSILTLAQTYEVSHKTSASALSLLKDEGLIVPVRGLGYFVKRK